MRAILLLLILTLSACGSDKPINFQCPRIAEFRIPVPVTPSGPIAGAVAAPLDQTFRQVAQARRRVGAVAPGPLNIIVLSGGGKWGAYGAGLLEEWSAHQSTMPRPQFDIVTGVSTGALQSTFVFLGTTHDRELVKAYEIDRESQLAKRHGKLFFLRHGSTASLEPLIEYARTRVEPLLDRVAGEYRAGRRLMVGSVDALDGRMYALDLSKIAAELSGRERTDCYLGALLASAAIPFVFKQVRINDVPYFDAGVRHSVFLTGIQRSAARALGLEEAGGNLFILMNGDPGAPIRRDVEPTIFGALGRLRELTFDQIEQNSAYAVSQQTPGLKTWVATAENHGCKDPNGDEDIFNPGFMRCLIAAAKRSWANGNNPWATWP
jgi:predicted acylesterase/phospholipase RssA